MLDIYVCVENLTNEKDQDGWDNVAYFDDDSDNEVESLSSGECKGDNNSNDDEDSGDDEEARAPITNEKQCGHLVGKMIPRRKCS